MNLQFYLEKLHASENFQNFIKKNPNAFLCSGFFVIDKVGNDNKQHFDFFIPSEKKIFSFQLEEGIKLTPIDMLENAPIPEKLSLNYDFDFREIEKIINYEKQKYGVKDKIQKMLFSLQSKDGKDFLIGTIFVSALGMLKINIDMSIKKVILFEKKSFFDILKRVK
ncbi:hypothetical protein DRN69_02990 [Candidatus Pacearchaeota archaeon]|nr:MAG: hypothetical protein DRN69_02990 [Candidatus Pacearchaeota archaeon]